MLDNKQHLLESIMFTRRDRVMILTFGVLLIMVLILAVGGLLLGGRLPNRVEVSFWAPICWLLLVVWCFGILGPFTHLSVKLLWRFIQPSHHLKRAELTLRLIWLGALGCFALFSSLVSLDMAMTPAYLWSPEKWPSHLGLEGSSIAGWMLVPDFTAWFVLWVVYMLKKLVEYSQGQKTSL